jgi:preprotein translocase SecF subunit
MAHFKGVDFFPHGMRLPVVKNQRIFIGISIALALLTCVILATRGLNLGVDFKGGALIEVRAKSGNADLSALREQVGGLVKGGVQVQGFANGTDALIRIEQQPGGDVAQQAAINQLRTALADRYDLRNVEVVGAAVSDELRFWGMMAMLAALVGILIYVWFRFEWQFAVAAVVALIHDIFITMGILSLFNFEFDLTIVAALLTLAGYSVNDTVVTFDRIRENLRKYKKMPLWDLIDLSINETLSRTLLTAGSVFLAVTALYMFGTSVIDGFAFTMVFGCIIGVWSSVFVASPLAVYLGLSRESVGSTVDAKAAAPTAKF